MIRIFEWNGKGIPAFSLYVMDLFSFYENLAIIVIAKTKESTIKAMVDSEL